MGTRYVTRDHYFGRCPACDDQTRPNTVEIQKLSVALNHTSLYSSGPFHFPSFTARLEFDVAQGCHKGLQRSAIHRLVLRVAFLVSIGSGIY